MKPTSDDPAQTELRALITKTEVKHFLKDVITRAIGKPSSPCALIRADRVPPILEVLIVFKTFPKSRHCFHASLHAARKTKLRQHVQENV